MTLVEIEKKITDQDALLAKMATDNAAIQKQNETLTAETLALKTDNEVLKMSAKQKKAFEAFGADKKKSYMAASADEKKKMLPADEPDEDDAKKLAKLDEIQKASDARITKVEADNAVLKAENVAIAKAARVAHFTKRAEDELPHTPGTPVEKGETLMQMAEALGGEESDKFKRFVGTMKAADEALKPKFNEVGKWGGGKIPAGKELEAKAEAIAKRDNIDIGHAMGKAMSENPELYTEYSNSRVTPRTA